MCAVELEENEEGEEDARNDGDVGEYEEITGGRTEGLIESEVRDIYNKNDAADQMEEAVGDQMLGHGEVEGWRPG